MRDDGPPPKVAGTRVFGAADGATVVCLRGCVHLLAAKAEEAGQAHDPAAAGANAHLRQQPLQCVPHAREGKPAADPPQEGERHQVMGKGGAPCMLPFLCRASR